MSTEITILNDLHSIEVLRDLSEIEITDNSPDTIVVSDADCPHVITVDGNSDSLAFPDLEIINVLTKETIVVNGQGVQGVQGPPGDTDSIIKTYTNGALPIGGHRVVRLDASALMELAESTDVSHASNVLGVTVGAVTSGQPGQVQTYGEMSDPSFSFTPTATLFFDSTGLITETPPTSGFSQRIGFAVNATTIFIDIGEAILLS